jgi:2-iminobutanoate/2-iminopropanoate deaminase
VSIAEPTVSTADALPNGAVSTGAVTVGFYTPAIVVPPTAHTVYLSGVLSVDRQGVSIGEDDFELQMRTVFGLLGETLAAAGSSFAELVKMTTYLVSEEHIKDFYDIREELFRNLYPSRRPPGNTLLVVRRLVRPEFLIEIEGVATTANGGFHELIG